MSLLEPETTMERSKDVSFQELLIAVIKENPLKTEEQHKAICVRLLREEAHEDYLLDALYFALAFKYREALRIAKPPSVVELRQRAKVRREREVKERREVEEVKQQIVTKVMLLEMRMPNGKTLRECTGIECVGFGGWMTAIGKQAGPRLIGSVFNEQALQGIWKESTKKR